MLDGEELYTALLVEQRQGRGPKKLRSWDPILCEPGQVSEGSEPLASP